MMDSPALLARLGSRVLALGYAAVIAAATLAAAAVVVVLVMVLAHRCARPFPPEAVLVPLAEVPPDACLELFGPDPCWLHGAAHTRGRGATDYEVTA